MANILLAELLEGPVPVDEPAEGIQAAGNAEVAGNVEGNNAAQNAQNNGTGVWAWLEWLIVLLLESLKRLFRRS